MPSIKSASVARWSNSAWIRGALLAGALGASAALLPAKAQAADVQVRLLVDVADLIFRSGRPYYYDHGHYHPVVVEYDRWHRPVYYRYAPPPPPVVIYRSAPPPRYYAPPPPPHYRVSYRYDDRHRHGHNKHRGYDKHRGHGRGHDKRRGR
ncbi:hypothetical protein WQ53_10605 [Pseudoxanthomonas suwonensis]|uniref:Uncharacterized protein n=2 Tax=Pseudoxanthomonas suwonensis TaxID=314722 RepID=A0A0E3UPT7_9GAMM|nr:hypothetical protein WQ53_10605 [Pseudoxanthomonas suwonensis]